MLSDPSPDGKFAMRIVHEATDETLRSEAIRRIELIAVTSGKAVTQLLPKRTGSTTVFRRVKDTFAPTHKPGALTDRSMVGDIRNQYVQPICRTSDGRLLLYQWTINRTPDGGVESYSELTGGYDDRKRSFRILKARELTQEEAEKLEKEFGKE